MSWRVDQLGADTSHLCTHAPADDRMHPVGSVEDELGGAAAMGRRVRRNRRRLAGEVDRDLELLGELFEQIFCIVCSF